MVTEPPVDIDYYSLWPKGTQLLDESVSGDTATVNLSKFPTLGAEAETAAVQELVYTVTANDTSVKKVRLLVDGKAPQSGHDDWSKPVARAPMMDVQGWIWLLAPTEGATTSSPVAIQGYGTAFEGTISWEVTKNGVKVAEGTTQGGEQRRVRRLLGHGRARPRLLPDPRLRGLRRGRLRDPRRHQDVHGEVAAVSASGGCGTAGLPPRRCPPSRCAAPSVPAGTPWRPPR
jgi:hypothetical protein